MEHYRPTPLPARESSDLAIVADRTPAPAALVRDGNRMPIPATIRIGIVLLVVATSVACASIRGDRIEGTPIPLPTQATYGNGDDADLTGTLIEVAGCIRVVETHFGTSHLPIWPLDHRAYKQGDVVTIVNTSGNVVARTGEVVIIGGGEGSGSGGVGDCPGPVWYVD